MKKKIPVRVDGDRVYFVDADRKECGEYYVDGEGREVFQDNSGNPYYFGNVNGTICPITICPGPRLIYRKPVFPSGGLSEFLGTYRSHARISN